MQVGSHMSSMVTLPMTLSNPNYLNHSILYT